MFNIIPTANISMSTVLIMVDPLAEHDWNILMMSLETITSRHEDISCPRLRIEIMPDA